MNIPQQEFERLSLIKKNKISKKKKKIIMKLRLNIVLIEENLIL